ncbi:FAD-dependent oxidoreductase [Nonomuraea glycinis]|uniref:FAD-dependent oxidoreductase n=1 Tax=Nonomuraea glycinis TaxID=2047744 RepID=UPI0033BF2872
MSGPQVLRDSITGMVAENATPVLIVGGGMVGLSLAAFLSWHGVRTTLVERQPTLSPHPRARGLNPRTMELLRGLGLEERVRSSESGRTLARNKGVIAVETLAGRELGTLRQYFMDHVTDLGELSPTGWCMCHQHELEPVLLEYAAAHGADIRLGTELVGLETGPDGVTATLRESSSGEERQMGARYLAAADGPGSEIRALLGIGVHGPGTLGRFMNIAFQADLTEQLGERRFILCYVMGGPSRCALLPVNNRDRWMLHVATGQEDETAFTPERCAELVRAATGMPGLDVRILRALPWHPAARIADRFGSGRVFLAGDAAHVMPPTGAFGANTGVQDAHNLAWKLAAVLRGEAGPGLLDTYDLERRPVAEQAVEQAVLRHRDRPRLMSERPSEPDPAILADEELIFGYRYPSESGTGLAGTRAPHVPLMLNGVPRSTLDLYGRRPVLVAGPTGEPWRAAAAAGADRLGVRLDVHVITPPAAPGDTWCERHRVGPAGAVLVRPDGFVAWSAETLPADPERAVGDALARLLARVPAFAQEPRS